MSRNIVLLTGHVCSGKSTLTQAIEDWLPGSWIKIDVSDAYDILDKVRQADPRIARKKRNIEYYRAIQQHLREMIFTSWFEKNNLVVELLGNEPFFESTFRDLKGTGRLRASIELTRSTREVAYKCLEERFKAIEPLFTCSEEKAQYIEKERAGIDALHGIQWNKEATLFVTDHSVDAALQHIATACDTPVRIHTKGKTNETW